MRTYWTILKAYFSEKPTLEEFIAAHTITDAAQLKAVEQQYGYFIAERNFWV